MGTTLQHVMVVGGTPKDWEAIDDEEWSDVVERLGAVAEGGGATWLSIRPYGPHPAGSGDALRRHVAEGRCTVIVDPVADGREAFAAAAAAIPAGDVVDEAAIARRLYAPADIDPDLIVVLGPPDHLPPSLVWELVYGELVFLDRDSPHDLTASDLRQAIDTFRGRSRRFGGLDT